MRTFMLDENWLDQKLKGKTIKSIEYMSDEESKYHDFSKKPIIIRFTDGTCLIPLMDDEVNNGGSLYCGLEPEGDNEEFLIPSKMVDSNLRGC
tara:strand:- start:431 stop:709 length:279 start_codon:yes stop_codon:yes gene_type:complete